MLIPRPFTIEHVRITSPGRVTGCHGFHSGPSSSTGRHSAFGSTGFPEPAKPYWLRSSSEPSRSITGHLAPTIRSQSVSTTTATSETITMRQPGYLNGFLFVCADKREKFLSVCESFTNMGANQALRACYRPSNRLLNCSNMSSSRLMPLTRANHGTNFSKSSGTLRLITGSTKSDCWQPAVNTWTLR
ncbi:hypothetical protein LZ31DRAFT_604933 [Colletotrichum somersetense]|nr:hypothetical protein LZ31DRAFT_604933 [Colletotrichum somersetense]